jgi:hypothetical protein
MPGHPLRRSDCLEAQSELADGVTRRGVEGRIVAAPNPPYEPKPARSLNPGYDTTWR